MKLSHLVIPGLLIAAAHAAPALRIGESDVDEAVLFAFDDHSIPFTGNLVLAMEPAQKYAGNPVLPVGNPGDPDEWQMRYYGTVLQQGGKFRMWYIAISREDFTADGHINETGSRFAYAESADGIHWVRPKLGLTEFRGSRANNLLGMPEGFRGYHALVRYEPEDPNPTRRFKMMARLMHFGRLRIPAAWGKAGAFVPMVSADGLSWRVAEEVLSPAGDAITSEHQLVYSMEGSGLYRWQGMYYMTGQSWGGIGHAAMSPYGRYIEVFHSPDMINWSPTATMGYARQGQFARPTRTSEMAPGAPPIDLEQTHEGASVFSRGNVLLALTGFWHPAPDWTGVTHDLGFLISNDGLHFREPQPEFLFAKVGADGREWDTGGLAQGQGLENVGDKTFFWYGQMDQREGIRTGRAWRHEGGVGLLVLDRDRFGALSVRDPDRDGLLITAPITAQRPVRLWVNAEGVGPDSRLRIELLDAAERPLPAFSGAQAALLTHSGLKVPVGWTGGDAIGASATPFKVRVQLEGPERNAIRVYALYLGM